MTRERVIASYKSAVPTATINSTEHDEDRIMVYGKAAIVNSRVTIKGKNDNQTFTRVYRITYFLKKQHGNWQVVNSHATLILQ